MKAATRAAPTLLLTLVAGGVLAGCGGSSTPQRDPVAPPKPAPNADVGQSRAARDAALATKERTTTQQRTDAAAKSNTSP